jgi:hypothetical protein
MYLQLHQLVTEESSQQLLRLYHEHLPPDTVMSTLTRAELDKIYADFQSSAVAASVDQNCFKICFVSVLKYKYIILL